MDWKSQFASKIVTPEEAVSVIKSGDNIFMTGNCSVPQTVLNALVEHTKAVTDLQLIQVLALAGSEYVSPEVIPHMRVNTLFISDNVRGAVNQGHADFTPAFLSEIPGMFRNGLLPLDVALIHVSPPDEHGFCSYGVEVGVTKTAADAANIIIAEVNPKMPRTLGDSFIHVSKLDYIVEVDYNLPEVTPAKATADQESIAQYVASLIPDGATLQTGIGAIPDSVLKYLDNHKDLGIHTELFSDGVIDLVHRGIINNERKTYHPGKMVAGFVLGSQRLYNFIHDNPIVELHPTEFVNDPFRIALNDRMVAINSAIAVDLTGQVCADSIGSRFYSGVGGQVDFIRGAARSKGGVPIIALPSTAKGGQLSRIIGTHAPGAGITTSRNDVHYVITEFGIAYLYGKSIRERARALIEVAHPDFQEELCQQTHELFNITVMVVDGKVKSIIEKHRVSAN